AIPRPERAVEHGQVDRQQGKDAQNEVRDALVRIEPEARRERLAEDAQRTQRAQDGEHDATADQEATRGEEEALHRLTIVSRVEARRAVNDLAVDQGGQGSG